MFKIITFPKPLIKEYRLKFNMSLLKIVIFLLSINFDLIILYSSLSFSININFFGFKEIISLVKAPRPGPISIIFSFVILVKFTIFFIIFLSFKKF